MVDGIHFICRECGTPCDPEAAKDRGGLCARCAFPKRVTVRTFSLVEVPHAFINGREVIGKEAIAAELAKPRVALDLRPDPFKDAIDRACTAWARDEFGDEVPT